MDINCLNILRLKSIKTLVPSFHLTKICMCNFFCSAFSLLEVPYEDILANLGSH